jgi:hypothetical protein
MGGRGKSTIFKSNLKSVEQHQPESSSSPFGVSGKLLPSRPEVAVDAACRADEAMFVNVFRFKYIFCFVLPTSPSDVKSVTSKRGSPPDDGPVCFTIREENGVFVSRSKRSEIILVKTVKSEH